MHEKREYYVYLLLDPSKNDEPFYVGKGKGKRVKDHYTPGYLKSNTHKSNIINRYRSLGFKDLYLILKSGLTHEEAYEWETWYITQMYGFKHKGGLLVNQTLGGGGTPGFAAPRTLEWIQKISEANKGKFPSEETRRKMSSARQLSPPPSKEINAKISTALKGVPKSLEHNEKVRLANIGKFVSLETREKIAKSQKGIFPGRAAKWFKITSPEGTVYIVKSKKLFCDFFNLSPQHMGSVANGTRNHHKGWRCEKYIPTEEEILLYSKVTSW